VSSAAQAALAASRAQLRQAMAARGFADDGEVLRGPVRWQANDRKDATAVVDISVSDRYPLGPPVVEIADAREGSWPWPAETESVARWSS